MPLTLVRRAGGDTLGKLESAARLRFREAEKLHAAGENLGAIYLYGYSVEIRLKAAYYRIKDKLVPSSPITDTIRRYAENQVKKLRAGARPGHDILGWALLVEQARAAPGSAPLKPSLIGKMRDHAKLVSLSWSVELRYRANRPYNEEV